MEYLGTLTKVDHHVFFSLNINVLTSWLHGPLHIWISSCCTRRIPQRLRGIFRTWSTHHGTNMCGKTRPHCDHGVMNHHEHFQHMGAIPSGAFWNISPSCWRSSAGFVVDISIDHGAPHWAARGWSFYGKLEWFPISDRLHHIAVKVRPLDFLHFRSFKIKQVS